jgi:hypothetical protein
MEQHPYRTRPDSNGPKVGKLKNNVRNEIVDLLAHYPGHNKQEHKDGYPEDAEGKNL